MRISQEYRKIIIATLIGIVCGGLILLVAAGLIYSSARSYVFDSAFEQGRQFGKSEEKETSQQECDAKYSALVENKFKTGEWQMRSINQDQEQQKN